MVLALDPELVVLDEPAAGLDPSTRLKLLQRVNELASARGFALVVISHDLPAATRLAARSMVMYAGEAMEEGETSRVIEQPAHPYSWALLHAYPVMTTTKDLRPIRGLPPDPRSVPQGCPFHPRCTQAEAICLERPALEPSRGRLVACHFGGLKTLLSAAHIDKAFGDVQAVQGVSLTVSEGEAVGIIGPSGSGKTTLARILCGHLEPDSGRLELEGERLSRSWRANARAARRRIQLVMQDPWDALSPRLAVKALVREPLDVGARDDGQDSETAIGEALAAVGLPSSGDFLAALPHELSGGQLQRIALARALIARPKLLVADEPTSMLDASEQARLLVILRELQVEMGLGLILVSHDVAVVRKVTDRIVVLDEGRVVEEGSSETVSSDPRSSTARRLIEASPAFATGGDRLEVTAEPVRRS
jgi:peptide/nickel transport system ATP-binding protein